MPTLSSRILAFFLCVLCGDSPFLAVSGAAEPLVIPIAGPPFEGALAAIDAEGVATFRPARSLPLADVVRWGYPVEPRPQPVVLLKDGSRIVAAAAWSGGTPVTLAGDEWIVTPHTLGEMHAPRSLVRGIVFALRSDSRQRRKLEEWIQGDAGAGRGQDELWLSNDDRLRGKIDEVSGGTISITTESGVAKLPLARVLAAAFAWTQGGETAGRAEGQSPKLMLALRDGSVLYCTSVRAGDNVLDVQLAAGVKLSGGAAGDVVALQSLGSERVTYLSDRTPTDFRHVPYLSIEWPYQRDRNVAGEPLDVGGNRYVKGLGMHSAARLTYALDAAAGWRRFEADVAVDDSAGRRGSVTFGVYLLRGGQWQSAFTSEIIRGGDAPTSVSVDLSGATGLTLTVDYADRGDELDHADWLDARLVK